MSMRDCWHEGAEYKCVFVVGQKLQLLAIFSWDAANGIYHENQITVQGPAPVFNIFVKGDVWTYLQDGEDKQGNVYHTASSGPTPRPERRHFTQRVLAGRQDLGDPGEGVETKVDAGG